MSLSNRFLKNRWSYLKYLLTKPSTIKVENEYCYAIYSNLNLVHEVNYGYGAGMNWPPQVDDRWLNPKWILITPLTEEERARLL